MFKMNKARRCLSKIASFDTLRKIVTKDGRLWFDYMEPMILGDICFLHAHPGDNMQPIAIDSWIGHLAMSAVGGHGHRYQVRETKRPDKSKVSAIMAPYDMHPYKTAKMKTRVDSGAMIISNARAGTFGHEFVHMDEIPQDYRTYKISQRKNVA